MAIEINQLIKFLKEHGYAVYFEREPLTIIGDIARINRIDDSKLTRDINDFNNRPIDPVVHDHALGAGFAQKDDKVQDEEAE